jgi:tetratricopeptide (TPR) repeat protein
MAAADSFTLKRVQEMSGLTRAVVSGLVAAGFVSPARGRRNEQRFSFQDLVLLRTADALQRARIPPRKILRALANLRATLPQEMPLTGLRITAVGDEVAVHDRDGRWNPGTGQVLLDFDVASDASDIAFIARPPPETGEADADAWFRRGEDLESSDAPAAESAYRRAIALRPDHAPAHLNLGAMLCETGRCAEAADLYQAALAGGARSSLLHFNYAIALEDLGQAQDALAHYEAALDIDPALMDAHFNAGRLLENGGDPQGALRHFNAYRRLARP